jgi:hypothetical protein
MSFLSTYEFGGNRTETYNYGWFINTKNAPVYTWAEIKTKDKVTIEYLLISNETQGENWLKVEKCKDSDKDYTVYRTTIVRKIDKKAEKE